MGSVKVVKIWFTGRRMDVNSADIGLRRAGPAAKVPTFDPIKWGSLNLMVVK
jgi:hypothetical protein